MNMPMRLAYCVMLILALVPQWAGDTQLPLLRARPIFTAAPVALVPGNPAITQIGALIFERGYRLTSPDQAFGGFSSLSVEKDRFTLLSDGGNIVRFRLDSAGRLSERSFAELPAGPGSGWSKTDRDSESMTRNPHTGQIWLGFERANAIWRFGPGFAHAERHANPPAMRDWPENGGPEAMVRLRDGRFLVISEIQRVRGYSTREGLLFSHDPTTSDRRGFRFVYKTRPDFSPTDIAELPSGDFILLNRHFRWRRGFEATVSIISRRAIRPGAYVRSEEIARFEQPFLHENFEGIAVVPDEKGTAIWIVSDDNQSMLQQSLLLKFRLDPAWRPHSGGPWHGQ